MYTHNLDPILLDIGFIVIRWYSLAYIFGIVSGWWLGKKIISHISKKINLKFNLTEFDDLVTYIIVSLIIGGRLGYIIFYNFSYYISNPLDIFKISKFHASSFFCPFQKVEKKCYGVLIIIIKPVPISFDAYSSILFQITAENFTILLYQYPDWHL